MFFIELAARYFDVETPVLRRFRCYSCKKKTEFFKNINKIVKLAVFAHASVLTLTLVKPMDLYVPKQQV